MNVVTRGMGRRSGMMASFGYGRRLLFPFIERLPGQLITAGARVYAVAVSREYSVSLSRVFTFDVLYDRARVVVAGARTHMVSLTRSFATWVSRVFSARGDE